jgi:ABC-type spermidine/putrescine transport system permease subunit I
MGFYLAGIVTGVVLTVAFLFAYAMVVSAGRDGPWWL